MRPRPVIVLIDSNELRQSLLRFVLDVHRNNVVSVKDAKEALQYVRDNHHVDLIIAQLPVDERTASKAAHRGDCAMILLSDQEVETKDLEHRTLIKRPISELLDAIGILKRRRRGPKPGPRTTEPVPQSAAA
jgi:CheY-like chemotaxis protein